MKFKFFYTALLWLICSAVALAQNDSWKTKKCDAKFFGNKSCHIIKMTFKENGKLPYYHYGEFEEIPFGIPVYLELSGKSFSSLKIKIDTVYARIVNPLDLTVPIENKAGTEAMNTKTGNSQASQLFYLGSFEQGSQINFTILAEEKTKTETRKITTTTLDKEFAKKTLQKGEDNHKDVSLLDILKKESHPNNEFLVKLKIEEKNLKFIDQQKIPYLTLSEKSQTTWKKYSEIFSIYHHNTPDTSVSKAETVKSWESLGQFSFHVPKRYRFRIRAGVSVAKINDTNVSIQSRKANSGDLDGIDGNNLPLGFRASQFVADTTKIYRVQAAESKTSNFSPTLFLSIYPFSRKSLGKDYSLLGTAFHSKNGWTWNTFTQTISLHVGTTLNNSAFKNYYLGGNIELLEGLDFGVSYFSYETKKLDIPFEYQSESLNGSQPYFTNGNVPEVSDFLQTKRSSTLAYSLSVDVSIFQKAFASLFSTIKKGIAGS